MMKRLPLASGVAFACELGVALFLIALSSGNASPAATDTGFLQAPPPTSAAEVGPASFYADAYQGKPTASGEIFDMHQLTAAHRSLPFGTIVKVSDTENHRSVVVRINDRGPFVEGRVIDLSLAAAEELQMVKSGLAPVKLEIIR